MAYTLKSQVSIEEFESFLDTQEDPKLLQSARWGEVKEYWQAERVLIMHTDASGKNIPQAGALVLFRTLPGRVKLAYIPKGPVLDYKNTELLTASLKLLAEFAKSKKAALIRIHPPFIWRKFKLLDPSKLDTYGDTREQIFPGSQEIFNQIVAAGYKHRGFSLSMTDTIQPRFDAVKFLDPQEGLTLSTYVKKRAKKTQRLGIEVAHYDRSALPQFAQIMHLTEERKHVELRSLGYYEKLLSTYGDDARLLFARIDPAHMLEQNAQQEAELTQKISALPEQASKKRDMYQEQINALKRYEKLYKTIQTEGVKLPDSGDGKTYYAIAASLSIRYHRGLEMLYAGLDGKFDDLRAPLLIYITAMQDALEAGFLYANMGGIEGSLDDGLTRSKSHFNADVVELPGEFDYPLNPFKTFVFEHGLPLAKKVLAKIHN